MKNFFLRLVSSIIIAPIFIYCLYEGKFFFYMALIVIFVVSLYEIKKNVKQKKLSFFLSVLIFIFIFSLYKIRAADYASYISLLWLLSIVWITDIFGYLIGKIVKGPKLSKFSPNKTISGFFGSIFFSQFAVFVPLLLLNNFRINLKIILLQFFLSLISIFGDIFFSYVKRINEIKDYSNLIPGHGGILDRIDGMIFVLIFYYFGLILNVI